MIQIERNFDRVYNNIVYEEFPIHHAGASFLLYNNSPDQAATVTLGESTDGVDYDVVLFSTPTTADNLTITMQPNSYALISFVSTSRFVRISVADSNRAGVFAHLVQWKPIPRDNAEY